MYINDIIAILKNHIHILADIPIDISMSDVKSILTTPALTAKFDMPTDNGINVTIK